MAIKELSLKDKDLFHQFLNLGEHRLSVYAFENIYLWKRLFDISWAVIDGHLCIFFQDRLGCFLYLPPLGAAPSSEAVEASFKIMDQENKDKDISRIENIEEEELAFYQALGLVCKEKYPDYLCGRESLAGLRGKKFKSQRAAYNYFVKHYERAYQPFSLQDSQACLRLYRRWMQDRKAAHQGSVYGRMLSDGRLCLQTLLDNYRKLSFLGRVVKINQQIKAFTFGFKINAEIFCILYEVTDLSVKGLAQFIFREFCREMKEFRYINLMDDSGLENLQRVKLSYHPVRLIPAYIATRHEGRLSS